MSESDKNVRKYDEETKTQVFNLPKRSVQKEASVRLNIPNGTLDGWLRKSKKTSYICYEERRDLELVFRAYKNNEQIDQTRQQNDFTVIDSEFVNTIATIAAYRIIRKAEPTGQLYQMTYAKLMDRFIILRFEKLLLYFFRFCQM